MSPQPASWYRGLKMGYLLRYPQWKKKGFSPLFWLLSSAQSKSLSVVNRMFPHMYLITKISLVVTYQEFSTVKTDLAGLRRCGLIASDWLQPNDPADIRFYAGNSNFYLQSTTQFKPVRGAELQKWQHKITPKTCKIMQDQSGYLFQILSLILWGNCNWCNWIVVTCSLFSPSSCFHMDPCQD